MPSFCKVIVCHKIKATFYNNAKYISKATSGFIPSVFLNGHKSCWTKGEGFYRGNRGNIYHIYEPLRTNPNHKLNSGLNCKKSNHKYNIIPPFCFLQWRISLMKFSSLVDLINFLLKCILQPKEPFSLSFNLENRLF